MNSNYGLISPERMSELDANWSDTRVKPIETALGFADNRSVRFSLEDLQNYLNYAENEANTLGYKMKGVRVYFTACSSNEPNEKAGYAMVFFASIGTKAKSSEASMFSFLLPQSEGGNGDIPGGSGLNKGANGEPPSANYPEEN